MKKIYIVLSILIFGFTSCNFIGGKKNQNQDQELTCKPKGSELARILEKKELQVVVDYNSTNYFVYKGQPMGFQYELLKAFTDELGVDLKLRVNNDLEDSFERLNSYEFDLIAKNLTVTKERNKIVDFTKPLALTRQVLVQRKPKGADTLSTTEIDEYLIREQIDLAKKTIHVQKNSAYVRRLKSLSDEIGETINIIEDSISEVEQLIAQVASGEIEYTVCDENVAKVNQVYYPWIDVSTPISFKQKLSWAIRKNSPELKAYIDNWIEEYKETNEYKYLYYKYYTGFRNSKIAFSEFHSINGGKISEYDDLIREVSASYNWDWRLIAAVIMQESNFDPYAESWVGAMGLMQLMPKTAEKYEVENIVDPRENIRGGLELLTWLDDVFQPIIEDSNERLKFVLASYNVGIGHVMDARKLAMKFGKNPLIWKDNVDQFILNKSTPQYYKDPVVKWGYCRGEEPFKYVNGVIDRYHHYLNVLPDANGVSLVSIPARQSSWK